MAAAPLSYLVALVGIIALVTGIIGTCPASPVPRITRAKKKG